MNLPIEFEKKIRLILKEKFPLFVDAFDSVPYRAMRINTLKTDYEQLKSVFDFLKDPTPFCDNSYYIPDKVQKLGNHPLHHAGAFYMQEPSAASVVEAVGIEKGDCVLDLCASPGGKSTQAAAALGGTGFLMSNEFVDSRVKPLISNIERMGIPNAAIVSERPDVLCPEFPEYFDKVIVDAPCSGEGMFRKESAAVQNWSAENVAACAVRQKKILDCAAACVKPGGKLVYSTCTYSFEENEQVIEYFLGNNPDFKLVKPCKDFGESAVLEFTAGVENIGYARRIFNFNGGEGHFVAVMQKKGVSDKSSLEQTVYCDKSRDSDCRLFSEFYKEYFKDDVPHNTVSSGGMVYITPDARISGRIKIKRNGILAGVCRNGRFIPEHALFNNPFHHAVNVLDLQLDDIRTFKFLHGEEIFCDTSLKGYTQVKICGIPTGFGKASNGTLKNHYPKGLRLL